MRLRHARIGLIALAAAGLVGCSVALDFEECSVDDDCARFGSGLRCIAGTCDGNTATFASLLGPQCPTVFGASPEQLVGDTLVLGTLLPATGSLADFGPPIGCAVGMAVKEINQVGGLFGKSLAVVSCDTATDEATAVAAARHLVDVVGVPAIIGAASSANTTAAFTEVAHDAGVLMVSPASTAPSLTNLPDSGLLWRTAPSDAAQGVAMAEYLRAEGFEKIAVINRDDTYGAGLSEVLSTHLCITLDFPCDADHFLTADYTEETLSDDQAVAALEVRAFAPDVLVFIGFVEGGVAFVDALGDDAKSIQRFVFSDGLAKESLVGQIPDDVACKVLGTRPNPQPDGAEFQLFGLRYKKECGAEFGDDPTLFTANAYDAAYLIAYAAAAAFDSDAGFTGASLAAQMARMSSGKRVPAGTSLFNQSVQTLRNDPEASIDYDGASGLLTFDPQTGDPQEASVEAWVLDVDEARVVSVGIVFDADGYAPPASPVTCP